MLVYEGLKKDFLYSVESDKIAEEIENSILKKLGRHTGESEFNSWIHSMEYMYTTFPKLPNELILWFLVMMQRINLEWLLSS